MTSTVSIKEVCNLCSKKKGIIRCQGCQTLFCRDDYDLHREELDQKFNAFANELNGFQDISNEEYVSLKTRLTNRIKTWEKESIEKVKTTAEEACRQVDTQIASSKEKHIICVREIGKQLQQNQQSHELDERDLKEWKEKLNDLRFFISQPHIHIQEQHYENPCIANIFASEPDRFEKTCGHVHIQDGGMLACHSFNLFGSSGVIRGQKRYSNGMHRIRLKIHTLDVYPWWFFGIISESTPMQPESQKSPSSYGWAGHNEIYMNGKSFKNMNGYTSDFLVGDIIELILDCDNRLIRMVSTHSMQLHEIPVELKHCPFPWMLHLNLFHIQTRIRINP